MILLLKIFAFLVLQIFVIAVAYSWGDNASIDEKNKNLEDVLNANLELEKSVNRNLESEINLGKLLKLNDELLNRLSERES